MRLFLWLMFFLVIATCIVVGGFAAWAMATALFKVSGPDWGMGAICAGVLAMVAFVFADVVAEGPWR